MKRLIIILLRFVIAFILLFQMSCLGLKTLSTADVRYNAINEAYPRFDLYPHPYNETEIIAIDWKMNMVFLVKMGGSTPYNFIILDKSRNSNYMKNYKHEPKNRPTNY